MVRRRARIRRRLMMRKEEAMAIRDLVPWGRNSTTNPAIYRNPDESPFLTLHREMNRLFDDMWRSFDAPLPGFGRTAGWSPSWPSVEISETDKDITVTAEVAGLDEKDIDASLDDGVLILKGEKRAENEDKDRQFSERYYGRFERRIPLPAEVEEDKVSASFKNGVLTVSLPKTPGAQSRAKRIAINGKRAA
jgi:HSP20 family protein